MYWRNIKTSLPWFYWYCRLQQTECLYEKLSLIFWKGNGITRELSFLCHMCRYLHSLELSGRKTLYSIFVYTPYPLPQYKKYSSSTQTDQTNRDLISKCNSNTALTLIHKKHVSHRKNDKSASTRSSGIHDLVINIKTYERWL